MKTSNNVNANLSGDPCSNGKSVIYKLGRADKVNYRIASPLKKWISHFNCYIMVEQTNNVASLPKLKHKHFKTMFSCTAKLSALSVCPSVYLNVQNTTVLIEYFDS